jgi:hypothetical protein
MALYNRAAATCRMLAVHTTLPALQQLAVPLTCGRSTGHAQILSSALAAENFAPNCKNCQMIWPKSALLACRTTQAAMHPMCILCKSTKKGTWPVVS